MVADNICKPPSLYIEFICFSEPLGIPTLTSHSIPQGFLFSGKLSVWVMKTGWFLPALVCKSAKAEGAKAFALNIAVFRCGSRIKPSSPGFKSCHGAGAGHSEDSKLSRAVNKRFQAHIKDLQCQ